MQSTLEQLKADSQQTVAQTFNRYLEIIHDLAKDDAAGDPAELAEVLRTLGLSAEDCQLDVYALRNDARYEAEADPAPVEKAVAEYQTALEKITSTYKSELKAIIDKQDLHALSALFYSITTGDEKALVRQQQMNAEYVQFENAADNAKAARKQALEMRRRNQAEHPRAFPQVAAARHLAGHRRRRAAEQAEAETNRLQREKIQQLQHESLHVRPQYCV